MFGLMISLCLLPAQTPPAVMPRENVEVRVKDIRVGEVRWLQPTDLGVDRHYRCWVVEDAYSVPRREGFHTIQIVREPKGFCVVVPPDAVWRPAQAWREGLSLVPVSKITVR